MDNVLRAAPSAGAASDARVDNCAAIDPTQKPKRPVTQTLQHWELVEANVPSVPNAATRTWSSPDSFGFMKRCNITRLPDVVRQYGGCLSAQNLRAALRVVAMWAQKPTDAGALSGARSLCQMDKGANAAAIVAELRSHASELSNYIALEACLHDSIVRQQLDLVSFIAANTLASQLLSVDPWSETCGALDRVYRRLMRVAHPDKVNAAVIRSGNLSEDERRLLGELGEARYAILERLNRLVRDPTLRTEVENFANLGPEALSRIESAYALGSRIRAVQADMVNKMSLAGALLGVPRLVDAPLVGACLYSAAAKGAGAVSDAAAATTEHVADWLEGILRRLVGQLFYEATGLDCFSGPA